MEKPPVLSDRKIVIHLENGAMIDVPLYSDLEAQRDADVEWYEKKRIEWTRMDRNWLRIVKGWRRPEAVNTLIKQARQDTAREIFDWIDSQRQSGKTLIQGVGYGVAIADDKLGNFESKYLIPPNPVGAGDV